MRKIIALFAFVCCLTSCNVTESIVFNEDGSGEFLVSYDMGEVMEKMGEVFGGDDLTDEGEEEEAKQVIDTVMVFSEIMETFKDSVAALPEDKRLALEAVKDMYMKMHMDENTGEMNFGIGMKFNSISDLVDIQEKIKMAQGLNSQGGQVDAMKNNTPLGKFMGNDNNGVSYNYTANGFSRETTIIVPEEEDAIDPEELFNSDDPSEKEIMEYFEKAFYNVKLTFPKAIKSTNIEGAELSKDRKTITYKANWIEYIKNPKLLDSKIEFVDE